MTEYKHGCLEQHYQRIESSYFITSSGRLSNLVTANGNLRSPIHRWFHMKEAYSSALLEAVLREVNMLENQSITVLDPFSGGGTTGVSLGDLVRDGKLPRAKIRATEVNPFLHFVTSAKLRGHTSYCHDLESRAGFTARRALSTRDGRAVKPALSTFSNGDYFSQKNIQALLALKASLNKFSELETDKDAIDYLRLALAATVEPSSNLRRDGRALRFTTGKASADPIDTFLTIVERMSQDQTRSSLDFCANVELLDSRRVVETIATDYDVAVFPPPYPNNIDYTEIYKLEGWFLDYYGSKLDFTNQRNMTVRSHNSLRWGNQYSFQSTCKAATIHELLAPILSAIPNDRYKSGRHEVVLGYADDMFQAISAVHRALRPNGRMVFVVGNSLHGKAGHDFVIASDLILSYLSELIGFRIDKIEVARYPSRRKSRSSFLRESVVFATKATT